MELCTQPSSLTSLTSVLNLATNSEFASFMSTLPDFRKELSWLSMVNSMRDKLSLIFGSSLVAFENFGPADRRFISVGDLEVFIPARYTDGRAPEVDSLWWLSCLTLCVDLGWHTREHPALAVLTLTAIRLWAGCGRFASSDGLPKSKNFLFLRTQWIIVLRLKDIILLS